MDIAHMNLDDRSRNRGNSVGYGIGIMSISPCVEHYAEALGIEARRMKRVDKTALAIMLLMTKLNGSKTFSESCDYCVESLCSVDFRFAPTEQIQVW